MKNVPKIVYDVIEREDLQCNECNGRFKKRHLSLVGIMSSVAEKDHREVLTLGFLCKKCQELVIFEIQDMELMELSTIVREESVTSRKRRKE